MFSNAHYFTSPCTMSLIGVCDLISSHLCRPSLNNDLSESDGFVHRMPATVSRYLVCPFFIDIIHGVIRIGYLVKIVFARIIVIFVVKSNSIAIGIGNITNFPKNLSSIDHQISTRIPARTAIEAISIC